MLYMFQIGFVYKFELSQPRLSIKYLGVYEPLHKDFVVPLRESDCAYSFHKTWCSATM